MQNKAPSMNRTMGAAPSHAGSSAGEIKHWLDRIDLKDPDKELFDRTAFNIAQNLKVKNKKGDDSNTNSSRQIRRFYDELLRYRMALKGADAERFRKTLPFIRMLNARAAYAAKRKAEGETLVDENFTLFLSTILDQINDTTTLDNACTLFEAVIGFKYEGNKH